MTADVFQKLARHLDELPGGYPATESGVELRILRRLFTPEEAELALHVSFMGEEPRVIARRARITPEDAAHRLEAMALKGLIFRTEPDDGPPLYWAIHFFMGIWEFQVNDLNPELVQDFREYWRSHLADDSLKLPQLRTIPVGESLDVDLAVMTYETAEKLVQTQEKILVAHCICRQDHRILGEGCSKPLETCMMFGDVAEYYFRNGLGRMIDQQEALEILKLADQAELVIQPGNAVEPVVMCFCCGCCCAVLEAIKRDPVPASRVSTPFVTTLIQETCVGCGTCVGRCQMEALALDNGTSSLNADRCIGCGLCITTCPTESLRLTRKPASEQPAIPRDYVDFSIKLGQARGRLSNANLARMMAKSKMDRLLATGRL